MLIEENHTKHYKMILNIIRQKMLVILDFKKTSKSTGR